MVMTAPDMTAADRAPADRAPADSAAADSAAARVPCAAHDEHACAQAWAALTAAHALVTEQLSAALTRTCGLSINEFQILLRVDRAPDPGVRLGELCPAVRLTQPSLSRAVARLERHGWLRRAGAPADGRGVMVTITAAGREVLGRGSAVHAQTISELLLDRLTADEQDLLARALTRVAEGQPGTPPGPSAAGPAPTVSGNSPTVQEDS
jgi:DNA-binding MarR family transcriptional regulator